MITAPEDRAWWIAADGKWYPPETHPDADPASASGEPGWWLASDGLWYPPETHPGAQGAPPLEVPSSDGTSAEWTEMLATFAAFETRPRPIESVPSSPTPRRRRGLIAVSLVVTLAVAASVIGVVATTGPNAPSRPAATGWADHSLRVVGSPVAGDGKVLLLDVSPSHDLQLAAVDPANGSVGWKMPFSPSGITPGVQFGPVIVQNVALDLAPAGSAKDAGVYLKGIDVRTGKVAWSLPQQVEATDPPQACNNDHDFCVPVWDTQTTTALVALDAVDGQPVFATQGPYRNLSESAPGNANRGGIWQTSDSAPTFTWVDANGQRTWTRGLTDLFGGSQYGPDNGYNFALEGGVNVGSVGVASSGNTTPLGESKTVGIRSADGSVAWSVPGAFMCGGSLQFLATDLVCQYTGSEQSKGQTPTISGGIVLRGLDPATGTLTWSRSVGQPTELSNGQNVAFADATHLVVQSQGGRRMVLDTDDGSLTPVGHSQVFWCEQDPLYKVNASTDGSVDGERASAPVFTACSASGARLDAQPTSRPGTVGVSIDGYFVWPSTDGLRAAPPQPTS
ncbi:MAG: PQQ-binding-like beta-propeller repeat protein [Acidimicrobiales bacterium]